MALDGLGRIKLILQVYLSDTIVNIITEEKCNRVTICGMTTNTMICHLENSYVPAHKKQTEKNLFTLS